MALFGRKRQPAPVGQSLCVLTRDGAVGTNVQHLPQMTSQALAQLACVSWICQEAMIAHREGGVDQFRVWMSLVNEAWRDPEGFNARMNPAGVYSLDPGEMPDGAVFLTWGKFTITFENNLLGSWEYDADARTESRAPLRVLGGLVDVVNEIGNLTELAWSAATLISLVAEDPTTLDQRGADMFMPMILLEAGEHHANATGTLP